MSRPVAMIGRRGLLALVGSALVAGPALAAAPESKGATKRIQISNLAFGPAPALKVGDKIEWTNTDLFQHSVTARDGQFDLELKPKARGKTVLTKAGTVEVYCRYHPGMTITLVVAP